MALEHALGTKSLPYTQPERSGIFKDLAGQDQKFIRINSNEAYNESLCQDCVQSHQCFFVKIAKKPHTKLVWQAVGHVTLVAATGTTLLVPFDILLSQITPTHLKIRCL